MFTKENLTSLDRTYFKVRAATCFCIILESRNTRHEWLIQTTGFGDEVRLCHRHKRSDTWHDQKFHGKRHTLKGAVRVIREHDRYVMHEQYCRL